MTRFVERRKNGTVAGGGLVKPGEIVVAGWQATLLAVTGRSVAVCVWDVRSRMGGMCHFSEPAVREAGKATARFGNVAVVTLVNLMRKRAPGCILEAHILGGGSLRSDDAVGAANADMARRVLHARDVAVVSEDVGGCKGRKIAFDTGTGHVAVLKVHQLRSEDWGR